MFSSEGSILREEPRWRGSDRGLVVQMRALAVAEIQCLCSAPLPMPIRSSSPRLLHPPRHHPRTPRALSHAEVDRPAHQWDGVRKCRQPRQQGLGCNATRRRGRCTTATAGGWHALGFALGDQVFLFERGSRPLSARKVDNVPLLLGLVLDDSNLCSVEVLSLQSSQAGFRAGGKHTHLVRHLVVGWVGRRWLLALAPPPG